MVRSDQLSPFVKVLETSEKESKDSRRQHSGQQRILVHHSYKSLDNLISEYGTLPLQNNRSSSLDCKVTRDLSPPRSDQPLPPMTCGITDACTSPTYPYRTDTMLVLVPNTTLILLGNKFNISYLWSPLFCIVFFF